MLEVSSKSVDSEKVFHLSREANVDSHFVFIIFTASDPSGIRKGRSVISTPATGLSLTKETILIAAKPGFPGWAPVVSVWILAISALIAA